MSQLPFFISLLGICDGATAEAAETMSMHNIFSHNCYLCISNNYRNLHCKVCIVAKTLRRDNSVWKIHTTDCDGFFLFITYNQEQGLSCLDCSDGLATHFFLTSRERICLLHVTIYGSMIVYSINWLNGKGSRHVRSRMDSSVNKEKSNWILICEMCGDKRRFTADAKLLLKSAWREVAKNAIEITLFWLKQTKCLKERKWFFTPSVFKRTHDTTLLHSLPFCPDWDAQE